jgi:uncharacterized OsmC-like protein
MPQLDSYFDRKRDAITARRDEWSADRAKGVIAISASSRVAGVTGVRPTTMGAHTVISDSGIGLAGHALGATAPELLLGALASCLVHTYVIHAVLQGIACESIEVTIHGEIDMGVVVGIESAAPIRIAALRYVPRVIAHASAEQLEMLHDAVEHNCPVLNTLALPNEIARVREGTPT